MNALDPTDLGVSGIGKRPNRGESKVRQTATQSSPVCDIPEAQPLLAERLLNKRELAYFLSVSVRTVERLLARGLPAVTISGIRRFERAEVMAWLRKKEKRRG